MAATITVPHSVRARVSAAHEIISSINESPIVPRRGVITLSGYGLSVSVDKGHLILRDGIGNERRASRFARVNHGIRRLVIIGADGSISLAGLRWLADQNASLVMLERDGQVLLTTGPNAPSDARVRRAQALTVDSDGAVQIARELISMKLNGQECVARHRLLSVAAADSIGRYRAELEYADSISSLRLVESQGAAAYWKAWRTRPIHFPKSDLLRVPEHWLTFGSRNSPVSNAPRNACNPGNAMLNFLYTMLESETRLATVALGLDPGLGLIHVDSAIRDSLVYDLMEPIRPIVDAVLFDLLQRSPLKRNWFFEKGDGTCRLMPEIVERLAETSQTWKREAAPIAEWYAQAICSRAGNKIRGPGARLTRWERSRNPEKIRRPRPSGNPKVCVNCGAPISKAKTYCKPCAVRVSAAAITEGARQGRIKARSPEAIARRRASSQRQNEALQAWNPADMPDWLTGEFYTSQIQPQLRRFTRPAIAAATGVSVVYAGEWRNGNCVPHRRHWKVLAELVGILG